MNLINIKPLVCVGQYAGEKRILVLFMTAAGCVLNKTLMRNIF